MSSLKTASLLLFSTVPFACGGRTALDMDPDGAIGTGGDVPTSGGRASGGAASGGRAGGGVGGGGTGTGGRSTGGSGGTGAECPDGTFGEEGSCEPWQECAPGQYVFAPGTAATDRQCSHCPEHTFSSDANQESCFYSGCAFSEQVVSPAASTHPAKCEPDGDYVDLGSTEGQSLIGLRHLDEVPSVGLTTPYQTVIEGYVEQTLIARQLFPHGPGERSTDFALGPAGEVYLAGYAAPEDAPEVWLDEFALAGDTQRHLFATADTVDEPHVMTTAADWLFSFVDWSGNQPTLHLATAPFLAPSFQSVGLSRSATSVAAQDPKLIWMAGDDGDTSFVGDVRDLIPMLETISIPHAFVPRALAPTDDGALYVVGHTRFSHESFEVLEIDAAGVTQRSWAFFTEAGASLLPMAIGLDEDQAVYVSATHVPSSVYSYPDSGPNVLVARFDLVTSEQSFKEFIGPGDDAVMYQTVTPAGHVYIAGRTDSTLFLRRAF